jgi:hypothetical protein
MYNEMASQYGQEFGENQQILGALTKSFQPILNAGINQEGFSPQELANLNSQAITGTGQNYAHASAALGEEQGAEGGGSVAIPSGAKNQQQEQLASSAAQNESGIQSGILANDYATGRNNYLTAAEGLEGVAGQENPASFANATTGAGSAAASTENQITQANQSWLQLASAGLGAGASAFGSYENNH